tara:strand:+ start:1135 stop:1557 length:423 start_codon:yes stop_codon:yes gene_type:complete
MDYNDLEKLESVKDHILKFLTKVESEDYFINSNIKVRKKFLDKVFDLEKEDNLLLILEAHDHLISDEDHDMEYVKIMDEFIDDLFHKKQQYVQYSLWEEGYLTPKYLDEDSNIVFDYSSKYHKNKDNNNYLDLYKSLINE